VGFANEACCEIAGNTCTALLDTGSTVSTLALSFHEKYLQDIPIRNLDNLLKIEGAGGHNLPYLGYIETDITIPGDFESHKILFLIVPDTNYNSSVPALIGTNFLAPLMEIQQAHYGVRFLQVMSLGTAWQLSFKCMHSQNKFLDRNGGCLCILRNAEPQKVKIPPHTAVTIYGKPVNKVYHPFCHGITTATANGDRLQEVEITPLLLNYDYNSDELIPVILSNPTTETVVVHPQAIIGEIQQVTLTSFQISAETTGNVDGNDDWMQCFTLEDSLLQDKRDIYKFLSNWEDVFSKNDLDIGFTNLVKHDINLSDETPFKQRHRRIPPSMYDEVKSHLQKLVDGGIIRPSHSPWASNMVLVRKKDNTLRICVDFRQLNNRTIKDSYYLPRIDEMLECLSGHKYFSILDMKSGYHQVGVTEEHKQRTAFTAGPLGFWEFNRLPFGLCNAPATYQRVMEQILGSLNYNICLVYLDDVIIFSRTYEDHFNRLEAVFQKFRDFGLKLSPKKCQFFKEKVKYIGHIISEEGLEPDPEKISKVVDWPKPTNPAEIRQFLGFAGYYRKYVKDFAKIARPLNDLLAGTQDKVKNKKKKQKIDITWKWNEEHDRAFQHLKNLLTSPPILGYPDFSAPFELHIDASTDGLGAVLNQQQDGQMRVLAFASRGLSKTERNYSAYKLEFLALKWAITEKFHDYLYKNHFTVLTDNNPLTYVLTSAKLDATGHRWLAALVNYNFTIKYRPGRRNTDADAMSRLPSTRVEINSDCIKSLRDVGGGGLLETISMNTNLVDNYQLTPLDTVNIEELQREDPLIGKLVELVENEDRITGKEVDNSREWRQYTKEFDHLVWRENALYRQRQQDDSVMYQLVLPEVCRKQALQSLHDQMGHLGRDKTLDLVRDRFYWPKMAQDVDQYIKSCERCVKRKSPTNVKPPLISIESSQPLELVCMDYLTLEMSKGGFQHILVITDHFTKYAVAIPTRNQTAKTTAEALWNGFIVHYGFPLRIHSDQGANFCSRMIKELCALGGVKKSRTTPYNPAGNGVTERMNQTLLNMLGTLEPDQKPDWKSYVAPLVHAYNCAKHHSTGWSPFYLMFGRQPRLPIDLVFGVNNGLESENYTSYIENLRNRLGRAYELAIESTRNAQSTQKEIYDIKARAAILEPGDRVLVKALAFEGKHKIADKWEKHAYIVEDQPNVDIPVYIVKPENGKGKKRTLHRKHLLPIGSLPLSDVTSSKQKEPEHMRTGRQKIQNDASEEETSSDSDVQGMDFVEAEQAITRANMEQSSGSEELEEEIGAHHEEELQEDRPVVIDPHEVAEPAIDSDASSDSDVAEPKRPVRQRRPPAWYRSGDYVVSHISAKSPVPVPRPRKSLAGRKVSSYPSATQDKTSSFNQDSLNQILQSTIQSTIHAVLSTVLKHDEHDL
jgi:transposase InsO family protein